MSKKLQFRPSVQTLETRRLMAGDVGMDAVAATPEEPSKSEPFIFQVKPIKPILLPDTASQGEHFDPVLGVDVHVVNKDSIWMDLDYPVKAGNTIDSATPEVPAKGSTFDSELFLYDQAVRSSSGFAVASEQTSRPRVAGKHETTY